MALPVIAADESGIGNERSRPGCSQVLGELVDGAAESPPLAALPLETVDVQHGGNAGRMQEGQEAGVGGVAHQRDIRLQAHAVQC